MTDGESVARHPVPRSGRSFEELAGAWVEGERPAAFDRIVAAVRDHRLPPAVARVADRYDEVVGIRDRFLWRWFHHLAPAFRLSTVPERRGSTVRDAKTLLTVYVTLLDDLAERRGDRATFRQARKLPFEGARADPDRPGVDAEYLAVTAEAWDAVEEAVAESPYRDGYVDLFRFDLRRVVTAMEHADLVSRNVCAATLTEAYAHGSHNMVVFPYADLDLLYSPGFDRTELSTLREVLWRAQKTARIGNWLSTWPGELEAGDLSSGVVPWAIENGLATEAEFATLGSDAGDPETLAGRLRGNDVRREFLDRWLEIYRGIDGDLALDSVDVGAFLDGMETVTLYQLATTGMR